MGHAMPTGRTRAVGYAYVMLLVMVAVTAGAAATGVSLGATAARRDAEQELLAIGEDFTRALRAYRGLAPGQPVGAGLPGPRTLDDLLRDPRVPGVRRFLRQIPPDPLTGRHDWGLVTDASGGIVGIHSLAEGEPIRKTGFLPGQTSFETARSYRDWIFGADESTVAIRALR